MPLLIKRYPNRKLYNTQTKKYITLNEIEDLIKDEREIKVIDNLTGNDITAMTLSQIILEIEKNNSGFLPVKVLLSMVQSGGKRIEEIRRGIFNSLSLFHHYDVEIERRINYLVDSGELTEDQANLMLDKLLRVGAKVHQRDPEEESLIISFIKDNSIPSISDFQTLIDRVEKISRRVDEYKFTGNINVHN